ncbi:MAG: hypothetical protein LBE38_04110 [Deltaproteobacteria bacterium]|jgi:hypothetical protein|nr:hypothetical protein [Deltaproteobacteria bacterium]
MSQESKPDGAPLFSPGDGEKPSKFLDKFLCRMHHIVGDEHFLQIISTVHAALSEAEQRVKKETESSDITTIETIATQVMNSIRPSILGAVTELVIKDKEEKKKKA